MTLANRITQVSSVEFTNTSSVRCIPCSPPKVKPPSVAEYPSPSTRLPAPPPLPLVTTELTVSGRPRACPVRRLLSFLHPAYERNHSTHFAEREHLILAPHTDGASLRRRLKARVIVGTPLASRGWTRVVERAPGGAGLCLTDGGLEKGIQPRENGGQEAV